VSWSATLPIYDLPELQRRNRRFWSAFARFLRREGIDDAPRRLDRGERDLIFSQVCGYPLQTILRGRFAIVGTPVYDVPGCSGTMHRAFIVVRDDAPIQGLNDLRGRTFAVNDVHSNTGMNLPRRLFAEIARGSAFFGAIRLTGSHSASVAAVSGGTADAASIDCVTYAFLREHRPRAMEKLRILAQTAPSPAIPFVASIRLGPERIARLRVALARFLGAERFSNVLAGLRITAITLLPEAQYDVVRDYESASAALGYPVLR
jgi:ABC-type phosphate/phosphonate transport system substrate-binding protein